MATADDQEPVEAFRAYRADRNRSASAFAPASESQDSFAAENGNVVESVCLDPSL
jgi:hypothetical protein